MKWIDKIFGLEESNINYVNKFVIEINDKLKQRTFAVCCLWLVWVAIFSIFMYSDSAMSFGMSMGAVVFLIAFGGVISWVVGKQYPIKEDFFKNYSSQQIEVIKEILKSRSKSSIKFSIGSILLSLMMCALMIRFDLNKMILNFCSGDKPCIDFVRDFINKEPKDYKRDFFWSVVMVFPYIADHVLNKKKYSAAYSFVKNYNTK